MHFQLLIWREIEMCCLITECTRGRSIVLVIIPGTCLGTKCGLSLCSTCSAMLPCPLFTSTNVHTGTKHLGFPARANLMQVQSQPPLDLVQTHNTELLHIPGIMTLRSNLAVLLWDVSVPHRYFIWLVWGVFELALEVRGSLQWELYCFYISSIIAPAFPKCSCSSLLLPLGKLGVALKGLTGTLCAHPPVTVAERVLFLWRTTPVC